MYLVGNQDFGLGRLGMRLSLKLEDILVVLFFCCFIHIYSTMVDILFYILYSTALGWSLDGWMDERYSHNVAIG